MLSAGNDENENLEHVKYDITYNRADVRWYHTLG